MCFGFDQRFGGAGVSDIGDGNIKAVGCEPLGISLAYGVCGPVMIAVPLDMGFLLFLLAISSKDCGGSVLE